MINKFFRRKQKGIENILTAIEHANDIQISQIIRAVIRRYNLVFPEWDILFLSIPKEPDQRRAQLEDMLEHLKNGNIF